MKGDLGTIAVRDFDVRKGSLAAIRAGRPGYRRSGWIPDLPHTLPSGSACRKAQNSKTFGFPGRYGRRAVWTRRVDGLRLAKRPQSGRQRGILQRHVASRQSAQPPRWMGSAQMGLKPLARRINRLIEQFNIGVEMAARKQNKPFRLISALVGSDG